MHSFSPMEQLHGHLPEPDTPSFLDRALRNTRTVSHATVVAMTTLLALIGGCEKKRPMTWQEYQQSQSGEKPMYLEDVKDRPWKFTSEGGGDPSIIKDEEVDNIIRDMRKAAGDQEAFEEEWEMLEEESKKDGLPSEEDKTRQPEGVGVTSFQR